jgi:hypothetical protein
MLHSKGTQDEQKTLKLDDLHPCSYRMGMNDSKCDKTLFECNEYGKNKTFPHEMECDLHPKLQRENANK